MRANLRPVHFFHLFTKPEHPILWTHLAYFSKKKFGRCGSLLHPLFFVDSDVPFLNAYKPKQRPKTLKGTDC